MTSSAETLSVNSESATSLYIKKSGVKTIDVVVVKNKPNGYSASNILFLFFLMYSIEYSKN